MAAGNLNATALTSAFTTLQQTLLEFVVPSAGLAAVYGGLIHAHIFHTPQAKETGKEILKYAIIAIIIAGVGPELLKSLAGILGVPTN
ncbi:hypothetical protein [Sulfobacillus thermosulfidooxidans]|uniref:hypothetical protein n=1 Tax=Sulfobacillus thermosulfidooxidans TaxID=28034 RepID=UPI0006B52AA8|nr:hypothetical protein [Sulfobacillus thermosulfidooxidans]